MTPQSKSLTVFYDILQNMMSILSETWNGGDTSVVTTQGKKAKYAFETNDTHPQVKLTFELTVNIQMPFLDCFWTGH